MWGCGQRPWAQTLALSHGTRTLGQSLSPSETQFIHLQHGNDDRTLQTRAM